MLAFVYNGHMDIHVLVKRISAPAGRSLLNAGFKTLEELASQSRKDLLKLHGFGKASFPLVEKVLAEYGLTLKDTQD